MKTDRIFVLLLVVMLPMSGCFDDAVGDAEGTNDADGGTTVINNYYNNTTADVGPEYIVVGGMIDNNTTHQPRVGQTGANYYPYNFSTTSGQTVYLHTLAVSGVNTYAYLDSDCGEGGQWSITGVSSTTLGYWIAGSAFDCQHSLRILGIHNNLVGPTGDLPFYFSAIYSIEDMTAIPV
jgi:hypothetical protein